MILKKISIGFPCDINLITTNGKQIFKPIIKNSIMAISSLVIPPSISFNVNVASTELKLT